MSRRSLFPFLVLILVLLTASVTAPAQQTPFDYDPDKIEPGTMYYYKLFASSQASSPKKKQFYYIKSSGKQSTTIKVLNIELYKQGKAPYLNTYKLNWDKMMLESATWQYIGNKSNLPMGDILYMKSELDFERNVISWNSKSLAEEGFNRKSNSAKFHIPTYFYFSNHVDGWTAMRFYPYQKKSIDVWASTGFHVNAATIKYKGEETIKVPAGKIRCHKFEMKGKGILATLFGKKAWLWMSAEDERNYMVRYKNNYGRGHLAMVDLRLAKVKKVSEQEWKEKVNSADHR